LARCVAARASCQGACEGDDQMSAHCRDRVCDMSFGTDGRRLGVGDFGKRQTGKRQTGKRQTGKRQTGKRQTGKRQTPRTYRRQRRQLRGKASLARRSERHRRRCTARRDGGSRDTRALHLKLDELIRVNAPARNSTPVEHQ
jgi:hypothetical protein